MRVGTRAILSGWLIALLIAIGMPLPVCAAGCCMSTAAVHTKDCCGSNMEPQAGTAMPCAGACAWAAPDAVRAGVQVAKAAGSSHVASVVVRSGAPVVQVFGHFGIGPVVSVRARARLRV